MNPNEPSTDSISEETSVEAMLSVMHASPEMSIIPYEPPPSPKPNEPIGPTSISIPSHSNPFKSTRGTAFNSLNCGVDDKEMEEYADKKPSVIYSEELSTAGPSIEALPIERHALKEPSPIPDETLIEPSSTGCEWQCKECKGYCLTCDKSMCNDCIWDGTHEHHVIATLKTAYQEKRAKTKEKVKQLDELAKTLQNDLQKKLEMLQKQLRSTNEQIDLVCAEAKQNADLKFNERKWKLQLPSEFQNKKQKLAKSLQLPLKEFMKQQRQVDEELDEMLDEFHHRSFIQEQNQNDEIRCELIPSYEMYSFQLDKFDTLNVWSQHVTICGIRWTVDLYRKDSLLVTITPPTKEIGNFPFELRVIIVHRECHKTIEKHHDLRETSEKIAIVQIALLEMDGFIENSTLTMNIGLRPANVLVENQVQKLLFATMQKNRQFCLMYLTVKKTNSQTKRKWPHSNTLIDSANRQWYLAVNQIEETDNGKNLDAFIVLWRGTTTKAIFFIELLNHDPQKNIRREEVCTFKEEDERNKAGKGSRIESRIMSKNGWQCFADKGLLNDQGFYFNENLRFRFGVCPISE